MKKTLFFLTNLTLLFFVSNNVILAVPFPSPVQNRQQERVTLEQQLQENATPSPKVRPEIKEKINQIREVVKERVQERIQLIRKARGYQGEIVQINEELSTITLKIKNNRLLEVKVTEETKIVGLKRENLKLTDLKVGNWIIAMGYLNEEGILEAKRIVVINKPKLHTRTAVMGKITDLSTEEKLITLKTLAKNEVYLVTVTDETKITKKITTRVQSINYSDLQIGDRIVVVGIPKENGEKTITAKIIHVIPGKAIGLEKPSSSPSPTPSPAE
ncbi:MAG: DUF5666 domain-containing protein [Microgenomates group bacterium]